MDGTTFSDFYRKQKMTHTFKVGDTGLTRDGRPYEICREYHGGRFCFAAIIQASNSLEHLLPVTRDGKVYSDGRQSEYDLMPPEQPKQTFREWFCNQWGTSFEKYLSHDSPESYLKILNGFADYLDEQSKK